jgi:hypothetical protein
VWTPFFKNLHEGKVIYRERFICLARIEYLRLTEIGVGGLVVPLKYLYIPSYLHSVPQKGWGFGGGWQHMSQGDGTLRDIYAGWTIWPEAERVRAIETLLNRDDTEGALELL